MVKHINTRISSPYSGNIDAVTGTIKQNIGYAIGNEQMEAEGALTRAHGNAEVEAARVKGYAEGVVNDVKGTVKNAAGNVIGNEQMRAEGEGQHLKGVAQKEINK